MQTKILKSLALVSTLLVGAYATIYLVHKVESKDERTEKEESIEFDDLSNSKYTMYSGKEDVSISSKYEESKEKIISLSNRVQEIKEEKIKTAKALDKKAEEERLAEIARAEAEKKRKEAEERKKQEEAKKEKQRRLNEEREIRRTERKEKKRTEVVSRSSSYQSSFDMTHFTAFCPTGCVGKTASGYDVSNTIHYKGYRIVAAPSSIPFYTKMRITYSDGSKIDAIVLDRGGDIGAGRLDLLVSSRDEAYRLGRKQVKVEILR